MAKNSAMAKQKVVDAIGKVVLAAQELSQAEAEYLGHRRGNKNRTLKLFCGLVLDEGEGDNAQKAS